MSLSETAITAPTHPADHPDYQLDCEQAIDMAVGALVDEAIFAGWKPETVYAALVSVANNQRLAYDEDPDPSDG